MADHAPSIYVGIPIQGPVEEVWRLTQTPSLHERWDLRFTTITLRSGPPPDPARPQRFLYTTRIGFGLKIEGEGETVGNQAGPDGQLTSALQFWSADPKSLIRQGSGYWKYTPDSTRVHFETGYDYEVRFGRAGRGFDRLVFRPLIGWATAWSFDRLRLWIEKGIDPGLSLQRSLVHAVARLTIAFVWLYHGLVPKLILHHPDELKQFQDIGLAPATAYRLVTVAGLAEVALGVLMLVSWRSRWPFALTAVLMVLALAGVAASSPGYLVAAFNPVTLNVLVIALSLVGYLSGKDLPSAGRCRRRPAGTKP
jgi:uncharacterized membrane protein YphA (DoxX/SURF4 family)